tara:strand:- start:123 stop:386 length:264 start_codon:yes stop_codon:yes gene_type:complete
MTGGKVSSPKRTARHYAKNAKSKAHKAAVDKKNNAKPENKASRAEHGRARTAAAKKNGAASIAGKDMVRGKNGKLTAGNRSKNRAAR